MKTGVKDWPLARGSGAGRHSNSDSSIATTAQQYAQRPAEDVVDLGDVCHALEHVVVHVLDGANVERARHVGTQWFFKRRPALSTANCQPAFW
jgi:hypothetical protein